MSKKLSKEQVDKLWDYANCDVGNILTNGEIGVCKSDNVIVVCCSNCGDYTRLNIDKILSDG